MYVAADSLYGEPMVEIARRSRTTSHRFTSAGRNSPASSSPWMRAGRRTARVDETGSCAAYAAGLPRRRAGTRPGAATQRVMSAGQTTTASRSTPAVRGAGTTADGVLAPAAHHARANVASCWRHWPRCRSIHCRHVNQVCPATPTPPELPQASEPDSPGTTTRSGGWRAIPPARLAPD